MGGMTAQVQQSMFDVDEVDVAEHRRERRVAAPKATPAAPMPGLEAPAPEAPSWVWAQLANADRVEAAASQIRSSHMAQHAGEFRLDAVAQTAVLMFEQQMALCGGVEPGRVLHERLDDDELVATWQWCQAMLTWQHPWLFPSWPDWTAGDLRRWIRLWWGVDMIGAHGPLQLDAVALTFQMAASMSGKQNAWGAFYTPFTVCTLMAAVVAGDEPWRASIMEPCVGAGSMLVAQFMVVRDALIAAQHAGTVLPAEVPTLVRQWVARVCATDIDREAVWTAAVNLGVRTGYTSRSPHPYREDA